MFFLLSPSSIPIASSIWPPPLSYSLISSQGYSFPMLCHPPSVFPFCQNRPVPFWHHDPHGISPSPLLFNGHPSPPPSHLSRSQRLGTSTRLSRSGPVLHEPLGSTTRVIRTIDPFRFEAAAAPLLFSRLPPHMGFSVFRYPFSFFFVPPSRSSCNMRVSCIIFFSAHTRPLFLRRILKLFPFELLYSRKTLSITKSWDLPSSSDLTHGRTVFPPKGPLIRFLAPSPFSSLCRFTPRTLLRRPRSAFLLSRLFCDGESF